MKFFTLMLCAFIGIFLSGWVLSIVWSWFISSAFNLPEISVATSTVITLLCLYLTHNPEANPCKGEKSPNEVFWYGIGFFIFRPLVFLLSCYIIKIISEAL